MSPPTNEPARPAIECHGPIGLTAAAAEDELGEPADSHAEREDRQDQHGGDATGLTRTSPRGADRHPPC